RGLARRDLDRRAGRRIASLPRGAVADAELAKAGKSDLTSSGKLVGDRVDDALHHLSGLAGGQSVSTGDLLGQLVLGHTTPFSGVVTASRLTAGEDDEARKHGGMAPRRP